MGVRVEAQRRVYVRRLEPVIEVVDWLARAIWQRGHDAQDAQDAQNAQNAQEAEDAEDAS